MNSDFKDILGGEGGGPPLSEEQMLAYFEGRLSAGEARAVEEALNSEGAESDALEGLQALGPADARALKAGLDADLRRMLFKKERRKRRGMTQQRWTGLAIGIILLLAILCYAVMWLMKHPVPH